MIPLRDTPRGVSFAVRVQPRASRTAVKGVVGDAIKIALNSPPLEGRANEELIVYLARLFDVSRSQIDILSGTQNRNKVLCVAGRTAADALRVFAEPLGKFQL